MKIRVSALLLILALSISSAPAIAQVIDTSRLPRIGEQDWRSSTNNVPWSTPIIIKDEFDGDYLAVLDKNYDDNIWNGNKSGIISNWSRKYLRIYSYFSKPCRGLFCSRTVIIREAEEVKIKLGEKVFHLEGKNGNFKIEEDLAYALKTAPPVRTRIKIRFKDSGEGVFNDIGDGTTKSWPVVYYDAKVPEAPVSQPATPAASPQTSPNPQVTPSVSPVTP